LLQQKTKTLSQQKTEILLQQKTKTLSQQKTEILLQKTKTLLQQKTGTLYQQKPHFFALQIESIKGRKNGAKKTQILFILMIAFNFITIIRILYILFKLKLIVFYFIFF
jgi:hypothetical protein